MVPLCADRTPSPPYALSEPDGYGAATPSADGPDHCGIWAPVSTTGASPRTPEKAGAASADAGVAPASAQPPTTTKQTTRQATPERARRRAGTADPLGAAWKGAARLQPLCRFLRRFGEHSCPGVTGTSWCRTGQSRAWSQDFSPQLPLWGRPRAAGRW